jgi:hypothetical protein
VLLKQSRFEPSGLVWLEEKKEYLIVSDDTGIQDSGNDHAPYLFAMTAQGVVAPEPVLVSGIPALNDVEAITATDRGLLYLVSSQNISKKGNRPQNRELIVRLRETTSGYEVTGRLHLLSLLLENYTADQLAALGLGAAAADGKPVINIEGAAWHDGALYLGLKQPASSHGALIWKVNDPESLFQTQRLAPNQITLFARVRLGEHENAYAGISDLSFDARGNLWVLSTFANVSNENQVGGLHCIRQFKEGRLDVETVTRFPGLKPEGLAFHASGCVIVVFDNDNKTPSYAVYEWE